jgi:signal transduction histidine kinase
MSVSRRSVLRNGFAVILGLLALATILAYFIQESFSRRSVEIHREFVQAQEVLTNIRRVLWMTGIAARDYYLNEAPNRAAQYERELGKLREEAITLIPDLKRTGAHAETIRELEIRFRDLWTTLGESGAGLDSKSPYEFIQREVVPRRDAAGQVLRELEKANRDSLTDSERRFTSTRLAATQSLLFLLGACLIAGILVAVSSVRYANHLERQATDRFVEVSEAKRHLEQLSARLMDIQEEERIKLSRELHDEVVQNIAVLKIEVNRAAAAVPPNMSELKRSLGEAKALAESTMRSVRDISMLLRPSLLDDLGLEPALQAQTEDFTRRTGTLCDLQSSGLKDDLSGPLKTCVYRVVQEALRNCEKHSHATRVTVSVKQDNMQLSVEIRDNGVGFSPPENGRRSPFHLGVLGMRERAAALGGTLTTDSAPNLGTVVRLDVPVEQPVSGTTNDSIEVSA